MPAITTHNLFAKNVYRALPKTAQNKVKDALPFYELFSQSFDFFFFNLFHKNAASMRKFGHYAHGSNTQSYLIHLMRTIKENDLANNEECMAYLLGSINHYILDTTAHPYIFYKTGVYRKEDKSSKKYNGHHALMEHNIDAYLYENTYHKPFKNYNIAKEILPKLKPSKELQFVMNTTYQKTYHKENMADRYFESYNDARFVYRFGMIDRTGLKKQIYRFTDWITRNHFGILSAFSYHFNYDASYMNLDHNAWCHPCDKEEVHDSSFLDLMEEAQKKAVALIKEVLKYLEDKKEIEEIYPLIPNLSYATALPIEKNKPMQYFEY